MAVKWKAMEAGTGSGTLRSKGLVVKSKALGPGAETGAGAVTVVARAVVVAVKFKGLEAGARAGGAINVELR